MSNRWQKDSMMSTTQLKARLRELRGIEPPGRLRDKLMGAVPVAATDGAGLHAGGRWFTVVRYVGAAAAIIIVASVVVPRLTSWGGPPRLIADINDRSVTPALIDQNHPSPRDINVCDNNAVP